LRHRSKRAASKRNGIEIGSGDNWPGSFAFSFEQQLHFTIAFRQNGAPMSREDYTCTHTLRVRWSEVDMQKIVFNGHYLNYIDVAVAEYWRAIGLPYPHGYVDRYSNDVYLRKATVEYLGPARYDDLLEVLVRVSKLGRTSMTFSFEIWRTEPERSQEPLIAAELVYVNADPTTMSPVPLPSAVRDLIKKYERVVPQ
jgi:acyl-CoA thioester hydrolase